MSNSLLQKCRKIKIVLTDVDGTLTDGGMYNSDKGDIIKKFNVLDSMGITLLRKNNIPTIIVSKEKNKIVQQWATRAKVKKIYQGTIQKELVIDKICKIFEVTTEEIAYIGDDVNDVKLLECVGLAATPINGIKEVKNVCHYICKNNGGNGAFREFAELILRSKIKSRKIEYRP